MVAHVGYLQWRNGALGRQQGGRVPQLGVVLPPLLDMLCSRASG